MCSILCSNKDIKDHDIEWFLVYSDYILNLSYDENYN